MKKIYATSFFVFSFLLSISAQFTDDMESYDLGSIFNQNYEHWSTWSGNSSPSESIDISQQYASSGFKSGHIGSGDQDVLLLLGNKTEGVWELEFKMYVPQNKTAYINFQGKTEDNGGAGNGGNGIFNSYSLIWNNTQNPVGAPGIGGAYFDASAIATFSWDYPENVWFNVKFIFNANNSSYEFFVNDISVVNTPFDTDNVVGALDFYSFNSNTEFYLDDFTYTSIPSSSAQTIAEGVFTVYPNPVADRLQINSTKAIDKISLFTEMGVKLKEFATNDFNPILDMEHLPAGTYFVKVNIGDKFRNVKIVK